MWAVQQLSVSGGLASTAYISDGQPVIGTVRGPEGASFRLYVPNFGMLDITDTGHQEGGPHYWQLVINDGVYWYDGQGAPDIAIAADGSFVVTGDGNTTSGSLLPLPNFTPSDLALVQQMVASKLIPYGQLLKGERPYSAVQAVADQYFRFSPSWKELGLTIYDWTSADFFRMDVFHIYRYTAVSGSPLDANDIINAIWTSNWPPYTAQDAPFMKSLMMTPATSKNDVATQYAQVESTLQAYLDALARITSGAMYAMPRTSMISVPMLYSGQVAIANLGEDAMVAYFEEYPGNAGPVGQPMGMPIAQALAGFMQPGNTITLKSFLSFTDSETDAQHYSNGIIIEMSPRPGAVVWSQSPSLTSLSNQETKIEYTYSPGSQWLVTGSQTKVIGDKTYTIISMQDTGLGGSVQTA